MDLYININGEDIQSQDGLTVVGRKEDSIETAFFYELGYAIKSGAQSPGINDVSPRKLLEEFKTECPDVYEKEFASQWQHIKYLMLVENRCGSFTFAIPQGLLSWLSGRPAVYLEIAKSLQQRNRSVSISLDRIYKESVDLILENITPDTYEHLVVNDEMVNQYSEMVVKIKDRIKGIIFVPFGEWNKETEESVTREREEEPQKCGYVYAIRNGSPLDKEHWSYSFYDVRGNKISKSPCRIVTESFTPFNSHFKVNVLALQDEVVYYVASKQENLIEIGEFRLNDCDFSVTIYENEYILYRHKRNYRLYEIGQNSSLSLKFVFTSKIIFENQNFIISGKYIQRNSKQNADLLVVDMSDGSFVANSIPPEAKKQQKTEELPFKCKNGQVFAFKKSVYSLLEGENYIGALSSFFAIESNGFIEKYDRDGKLLSTIEVCKNAKAFTLWHNGYISFANYGFCGYYDRDGKEHIVRPQCYVSRGWQSSDIKIGQIISDNCICIVEILYKGHATQRVFYPIDRYNKLLVKQQLELIDGNNHYEDFSIETLGNGFLFCSFKIRINGQYENMQSIVDGKTGIIIGEIEQNYNNDLCIIQ